MASERLLCGFKIAGSIRPASVLWFRRRRAISSRRRLRAAAASRSARASKPGFCARLSTAGFAVTTRPGKSRPATGGAKARLAAKPTDMTNSAMPTAQARILMRAARRPEASKKIGLLAMSLDTTHTRAHKRGTQRDAPRGARHGVAIAWSHMAGPCVHANRGIVVLQAVSGGVLQFCEMSGLMLVLFADPP